MEKTSFENNDGGTRGLTVVSQKKNPAQAQVLS